MPSWSAATATNIISHTQASAYLFCIPMHRLWPFLLCSSFEISLFTCFQHFLPTTTPGHIETAFIQKTHNYKHFAITLFAALSQLLLSLRRQLMHILPHWLSTQSRANAASTRPKQSKPPLHAYSNFSTLAHSSSIHSWSYRLRYILVRPFSYLRRPIFKPSTTPAMLPGRYRSANTSYSLTERMPLALSRTLIYL